MIRAEGTRKVLVVARRFPPHGGGGVQRTTYFVRYLPEAGWIPHVLTGPLRDRYQPRDPTLLAMLPREAEVTRSGLLEVRPLLSLLGKLHLARIVRAVTPSLPHLEAFWIPFGHAAGRRVLARDRIDLIYSSAYPVASHVVAWLLKRSTGLPWVADYRDEWSPRDTLPWPSPIHRRLAAALDGRILRSADRVLTTSPAHRQAYLRRFPELDPSKIVTITNGFEEDDFPGDASEPAPGPRRAGDPLDLVHVGSVFQPEVVRPLLEALERLERNGEGEVDLLRLRFVGHVSASVVAVLPGTRRIQEVEYVEHAESVRRMRSADALVLLMHPDADNIPGKTFEYLASGRPILAVVPPGPTADLVREAGAGIVVHPDDPDAIARALGDFQRRWLEGRLHFERRPDVLARYTRRNLTARLARVFDDVVGEGAPPPVRRLSPASPGPAERR